MKTFESTNSRAKRLFVSIRGNVLLDFSLDVTGTAHVSLKNNRGEYYFDHVSAKENKQMSLEEILVRSEARIDNFYNRQGWAIRKGFRRMPDKNQTGVFEGKIIELFEL